jgi:hypothetical protein
METPKKDLQSLSVNNLVDLLLDRASELLKATDQSNHEDVSRIAAELQELYRLIKEKRREE